jgi:bacterioferritin-associated ferredoxin
MVPMYICVCQGVTESQIRVAIAAGHDDMEALATTLGVGTRCGTCVCAAQWLIEEVHEEQGERRGRRTLSLVINNR